MTWSQWWVKCALLTSFIVPSYWILYASMDRLMDRNIVNALQGFSDREIRSALQYEVPSDRTQTEINRMSIDELRRRVETIEAQRGEVRMALIEAKLDTLFELTRILIGAALVYAVQVIGKMIVWFGGRRPPKDHHIIT